MKYKFKIKIIYTQNVIENILTKFNELERELTKRYYNVLILVLLLLKIMKRV